MTKLYRWFDSLKEPYRFFILMGTVALLQLLTLFKTPAAYLFIGAVYLTLIITRMIYLNAGKKEKGK